MDLYERVSYESCQHLTARYSTSFSLSSKLFHKSIRRHIYAVYGMARIADEVVDTYKGKKQKEILADLEKEIYRAIEVGYSTNPIVHAFAITANSYSIEKELIEAFFKSMAMDIEPKLYDDKLYEEYIYGSAEVIGLMCLRVFCENNDQQYSELKPGARKLGSAYQKVNFLRDLAQDYKELGRIYFPNITFDTFDDEAKDKLVKEIREEFNEANEAIKNLPKNSRLAVRTSYEIYLSLLNKLAETDAKLIKTKRVRIGNSKKVWILLKTVLTHKLKS